MSQTVGQIDLGLNINRQGFNNQLNGIANGAQRSVMGAFSGLGKMIGKVLAVKAVASFGKSCLDLGSDLAEVQNVVDVTFGSMAEDINKFAQNAITQFGLSETSAKKYTSTIGAMAKSFGFNTQEAAKMGKEITGRTADVASFYNLSNDESYTKMKSIFTGETESLKELGVVMTQAALDEFALQKGYAKTVAKMTEKEKVALRLAFVMEKTKLAAGDFANTSHSWANQTRILSEQFNALKATLGQGLIAAFTPIVKGLNFVIAKLQQAANYFKAFMELIFGKQAASGGGGGGAAMTEVADTTEVIADSAGAASDAVEGVGDAAKKAGKKAKGALANFDELNQLNISEDSGSGGGGSGAGGIGDMGGATDVDLGQIDTSTSEISDKVTSLIDGMIKEFDRLKGIFKQGFEIGIGGDWKERLTELQSFIPRIKEALKNIFDNDVMQAAQRTVDAWVKSFGQTIGAWASIGLTIATNLMGGITKYLEQNGSYIKDRLIGIFDASEAIAKIRGDFATVFADIFSVFGGETAQQITANIIGAFSNAFLGVSELALKASADIITTIAQPFIDNKDKIKVALEGLLEPIESITGNIKDYITNTFESILKAYDTYVHPAFKNIADGLSSLFGTWLDVYNTNIKPVMDNIATKVDELYKNYIQPTVDSAIECIGEVILVLSELYKNIIVPFASYIAERLGPIVQVVFNTIASVGETAFKLIANSLKTVFDNLKLFIEFIKNVFKGDWEAAWGNIKEMFSNCFSAIGDNINSVKQMFVEIIGYIGTYFKQQWDITWKYIGGIFTGFKTGIDTTWSNIKTTFGNILSYVKGTFTTAWSSAWNGIKNTFGGVFDTIVTKCKGAMNLVIDAINGVIRGMNKISVDVPKGVPGIGGKKFGFTINTIPKLARGGIVDQPTLAMVGEAGREAVVPLENNTEWVGKVAGLIANALLPTLSGGANNSSDTNRDIVLQLDTVELVRAFLPTLLKEANRQGVSLK